MFLTVSQCVSSLCSVSFVFSPLGPVGVIFYCAHRISYVTRLEYLDFNVFIFYSSNIVMAFVFVYIHLTCCYCSTVPQVPAHVTH